MNTAQKLHLLQHDLVNFFAALPPEQRGNWGVLTAQGVVEHFADSVQLGSGKRTLPRSVPDEQIEKFKAFMMSDKPFRENTKNPNMSETPAPLLKRSMPEAIQWLKEELKYFIEQGERSGFSSQSPYYGELNFDENTQLLYKHALHHMRQFGYEPAGSAANI